MTPEHVVVIAAVQGLTEFLPISSSAHLILLPTLLGWDDQGIGFDVAVHVGTLAAVVVYFRAELRRMARDWVRSVTSRRAVGESNLGWGVLIATLPVGLAGLAFKDSIELHLRSPLVIAAATVVFGLALLAADHMSRQTRTEHSLGWRDCLLIGLAQAVALIPGTSRSGITIAAGLALGLTAAGAARFSFLLSIPTIFLAGGVKTMDLLEGTRSVDWPGMGLGAAVAALFAYACIHVFLAALEKIGLLPFILYRLGLGIVLCVIYL